MQIIITEAGRRTDPGLVLAAIGRAAGADRSRTVSPLEALADTFGDGAWLLVLDNLEQLVQAAGDLGRAAGPLPAGGDPGYQRHGARAAGRAGVWAAGRRPEHLDAAVA